MLRFFSFIGHKARGGKHYSLADRAFSAITPAMTMKKQPILAIIGRPNVGKSTLFNRLVGKKLALVDDQPGVTRDRRYAPGSIADLKFQIVDTAGMEEAADGALANRMFEQTKEAMKEADILLFVIDARAGITPIDEHFGRLVRQTNKPVILIANKAESSRANAAGDIYSLGFNPIVLLSAEHGEGMGDLYEALTDAFTANGIELPPEEGPKKPRKKQMLLTEDGDVDLGPVLDTKKPINLVILGRPNAGKSTLVNAMIGEERMLVGPEAGITVVPVSALKKQGMDALVNACLVARETWDRRVPTAELNRWLDATMAHHSPPLVRGRRLKIKYMTQVKTRPPTFNLHCNMADEFPEAYLRYLTAGLRQTFDMKGTPIRLQLKESNNPFEKYKKRVNK